MDPVRATYERPEVVDVYRREGLDSAESALVDRHLGDAHAVLEVGCGAGRVAIALAARGHDVTGIDISEAMIRAARERRPDLRFDVGDARALPYEDGAFDATVFLANGVGHVPAADKPVAVRELARVTRPGGVVLVSFRSPYAVNRLLLGALLGRPALSPEGAPVDRPSVRAMGRLMRDAGLEVVETTTYRAAAAGRRATVLDLATGGQFYVVSRAGVLRASARPSA